MKAADRDIQTNRITSSSERQVDSGALRALPSPPCPFCSPTHTSCKLGTAALGPGGWPESCRGPGEAAYNLGATGQLGGQEKRGDLPKVTQGSTYFLTAKSLCALAWVGGLWDPPLTSQTSVSWQGCEDILSRQLDSPKKKKRGTGLDPGSSVAGVRASSPASAPATVSPFPQPARFLSAATLTAFLTDSPRVGLALGQAAHKCFAGVASKETRNSYFKSRLH